MVRSWMLGMGITVATLWMQVTSEHPTVASGGLICQGRSDYHLGVLGVNEQRTHQFVVGNTSRWPIRIVRVDADCGCVTATLPCQEISPGQTRSMEVLFNTSGLTAPADVSRRVVVHYQDQHGQHRLECRVSATLVRDVDVALSPSGWQVAHDPDTRQLDLVVQNRLLNQHESAGIAWIVPPTWHLETVEIDSDRAAHRFRISAPVKEIPTYPSPLTLRYERNGSMREQLVAVPVLPRQVAAVLDPPYCSVELPRDLSVDDRWQQQTRRLFQLPSQERSSIIQHVEVRGLEQTQWDWCYGQQEASLEIWLVTYNKPLQPVHVGELVVEYVNSQGSVGRSTARIVLTTQEGT